MQWTATRGEVEMLQGGTGAERVGAQQGRGAWPTAAANAVTARTEKGDGGDGIAVIRSKFKIVLQTQFFSFYMASNEKLLNIKLA